MFPRYTPKLLTDNNTKADKILNYGIDYLFFEPFTEELMKLSPEDFISDFLTKKYNIDTIIVGFNYSFGYKGIGKVKDLIELGKKYNFKVIIQPPIVLDKQTVSSTRIRNLLAEGKVAEVDTLLGNTYKIRGKIKKGKQLGRKYDLPTANLEIDNSMLLPKNGVYYTKIYIDGKEYNGLTNLGKNPTFKDHPYSIETYIYDFNENIYDKEIELEFIDFIRDEIKFKSLEDLFNRIKADKEFVYEKYIRKS